MVNLVSVLLLGEGDHSHGPGHSHEHPHPHAAEASEHPEEHPHGHDHPHEHRRTDHNLKAAYLHVLADAFTSVLAITALLVGRFLGWVWMDAAMGIVGGLVISRWAIGLLRIPATSCWTAVPTENLLDRIRVTVEKIEDTKVSDLHVWKIGDQASAAVVSLVTHNPQSAEYYHDLLSAIPEISHATIEVISCPDAPGTLIQADAPAS